METGPSLKHQIKGHLWKNGVPFLYWSSLALSQSNYSCVVIDATLDSNTLLAHFDIFNLSM